VRRPASYLRSLDPELPRSVWLVQAGGVVNSFGNGVVLPFIVIYLYNVRGISFAAAGVALSVAGVTALAAGLSAGTIVDRIGGRNTLLLGLLLQATAFVLFPLIREPWHAFALLALDGAGTACFWPGQSTLLA
jgi:predicted MFS family arabinose efflux permease